MIVPALATLAPSRSQVIRAYKERGGRVAAVLPIHYPRALFRAFDILPVEVWGPPQVDPSYGMAHLQPYVCSVVRNALAFLLGGGLDVADLIVVPHACDSLQGLGSILLDFVRPRQPVFPLYLPRGNGASALDFLAAEFRSLYEPLAEITSRRPSASEMLESVRREEEADALLAELYRQRKNLPLTQTAFYRLIRSREYLPAETFIEIARSTYQRVSVPAGQRADGADHNGGVPILLSGIVPEPMSLFDALTEMRGMVVADDLACCGRRLYPRGASDEPFVRMAQRILAGPPDSTRGSPIPERLGHLRHLIETSGAKGVVFYGVKFCEPELFYLPSLRRGLQDAGVPSVVIEVDLNNPLTFQSGVVNDPLSHQTLTRLEAFLEMIA